MQDPAKEWPSCFPELAQSDDQAKMPVVVRGLATPPGKIDELVTQVDKNSFVTSATQFELQETAVKLKRLINIANLEGEVIDTNRTGFFRLVH